MALAYAMRLIEQDKTVKLTNYGCFLAQFPPEFGVRDCRQYFMELRARHRALALRLRVQWRQAGLDSGLANAPPRGSQ